MGTKRNAFIGILAIAAFVGTGIIASAEAQSTKVEITPSAIDYAGFSAMTAALEPIRAARLVTLDKFNEMKVEDGTIILDTRSKAAFDEGHIDGAVHLNFSDFTEDKLANVIPSKDTRILIYCNNNFWDNVNPIMLKRVPLALNIPTFINLHGYGYENIYELSESVSFRDPRVDWTPDPGPMDMFVPAAIVQ